MKSKPWTREEEKEPRSLVESSASVSGIAKEMAKRVLQPSRSVNDLS